MARRTEAWMVLALAGALAAGGSAVAAEKADEKKDTDVRRRVDVLRDGNAYLGVTLNDVSKDDAARLKLQAERGALVSSVESGSPAEKAGLRADDVIVRFQGEEVRSARQLTRLVREDVAGRTATLDVSRGGAIQKLQAQLEENRARREFHFSLPDGAFNLGRDFAFDMPVPPAPPAPPDVPAPPQSSWLPRFFMGEGNPRRLGIEYQEMGDQLAQYFKLGADRGVLVSRVDHDGPAAKAGVKAGDVILKLEGKTVRDASDLREALNAAGAGAEVQLSVQRDGRPLDLKVKLGGPTEPRRRRGMTT